MTWHMRDTSLVRQVHAFSNSATRTKHASQLQTAVLRPFCEVLASLTGAKTCDGHTHVRDATKYSVSSCSPDRQADKMPSCVCAGLWVGGAAVAYTYLAGFRAMIQVGGLLAAFGDVRHHFGIGPCERHPFVNCVLRADQGQNMWGIILASIIHF
jgi:hypothetical protein